MMSIRSQKGGLSDCRSLSSNQFQSGRPAKASIGIRIEISPKVLSGIKKDSAEKHLSRHGKISADKSSLHNVASSETTKECYLSRSSGCKTSNADAGKFCASQLSMQRSMDSTRKRVDDGVASQQGREEAGDAYVDYGLTFATMKNTNLVDQETRQDPTMELDKSIDGGLKMKLWEILGNGGPSQKESSINSQKNDEGIENIGTDYNPILQKVRAAKLYQSSDPIETDSDCPNKTIRRPATRSMTKKRFSNQTVKKMNDSLNKGKRPLSSTSSDCKHKSREALNESNTEKSFFSFGKEDRRMPNQIANPKSEVDIEFRKISRSSSDNNPQTNFKCNKKDDIFSFAEAVGNKRVLENKSKAQIKRLNEKRSATFEMMTNDLPPIFYSKTTMPKHETEKSLSSVKGFQFKNDISNPPCPPFPNKKQSLQPSNVSNDSEHSQMNMQKPSDIPLVPKFTANENAQNSKTTNENGSHSSQPKKEKGLWEHMNNFSMPKFSSQHDNAACSPVTNSADASDDLQSPSFAGNATPTTPSRTSNEISHSPLQSRKINFTWNLDNTNIMDNDKPGSCGTDTKTDSFDDIREVYESRDLESTFEDGTESKEQSSLSRKVKIDSREEFTIKEFKQKSKWFKSPDYSDKSPLMQNKRRRVHGPKDAGLSEEDEAHDLLEASEQCMEDGLARAVSQLALAMRKINSKIQVHTNRKSCEILAAVADKIKLQLQGVDSKIQEEMGKFNGTCKSKRKHLESCFEEHQGKLRLIHEKFKEEVNHHLLSCSSTLEELEAQNIDIKATADRQKVLHRKLLSQVEEAVKDELTAAETSITAIRKDARKKLNSLKFALKEWLNDEAIS